MAIRVVYILDNKNPDVIEGATGWVFRDGLVKIFDERGFVAPMIEIRDDYVLSVERVELSEGAEKCLSDTDATDAPIEEVEAHE